MIAGGLDNYSPVMYRKTIGGGKRLTASLAGDWSIGRKAEEGVMAKEILCGFGVE